MRTNEWNDVVAGLLVAALGAFFVYHSLGYGVGPLTRMRAGNFPLILGGIAIAMGVAISGLGLLRRSGADQTSAPRRLPVRPLIAVAAAVAAFALLINRVGLAPAAAVAAAVAALGDREVTPRLALGLALFMAAFAWLVFKQGFRISVPTFAWSF